MIGFALIACIQFIGGIGAAYKSLFIKEENAWERIHVKDDKNITVNN